MGKSHKVPEKAQQVFDPISIYEQEKKILVPREIRTQDSKHTYKSLLQYTRLCCERLLKVDILV